MRSTQNQASKKTVTPRLVAVALLGAWFAVLFFFSFGDHSVISPQLVYTKNLLLFLVIWLGLGGILLAYGSISPAVVHGFSLFSTLAYCMRAAVSGGSYFLTFGLCGIMALMLMLAAVDLKIPEKLRPTRKGRIILTAVISLLAGGWILFLLVTAYTSYTADAGNSTGVYGQMLWSMSQHLTPNTTLEFGESVSHFAAHISPIFYLYLPFYMVIPSPVTLLVLQTVAVMSSVIPLSLIAKRKGLSDGMTVLICLLFCLFPALIGGSAGGVHEYALLLPLLLWLIWALEAKKGWMIWVFAALCLCVRETVAVHLFTLGLYWLMAHGLRKNSVDQSHARRTGLILMGVSITYLVAALLILTYMGKGTLITRFANITGIYNTYFDTLFKELVMNPAVAIYEVLTTDKLHFLLMLILPLACLPFATKKRTGLIFLLPLILLNLLSDFQYHYRLDYPYAFGMTAFLFYMVILALSERQATEADKGMRTRRWVTMAVCFTLIIGSFHGTSYAYRLEYLQGGQAEITVINETLAALPEDASVSASGTLLSHLTRREELYALSDEVETEYVVLDLREEWITGQEVVYYEELGYTAVEIHSGVIAVLHKGD